MQQLVVISDMSLIPGSRGITVLLPLEFDLDSQSWMTYLRYASAGLPN